MPANVECAQRSETDQNLFVDVGSNSGFYGFMAASLACPTLFFDLQPGCNKVVNCALRASGLANPGLVIAAGLSETPGTIMTSSSGDCGPESGRFPILTRLHSMIPEFSSAPEVRLCIASTLL